ncbi:hypothetical protein [Paenibacillus odorifer]|uniref:hypothetical protein n=2 Tax=Paenibacillus TaxID=44249 RepID=UPI0015C3C9C1|nr:hypothetical protein [Paenibacillus odorifer]
MMSIGYFVDAVYVVAVDIGDVDVNSSERSQSQQVKTQNSGSPILWRTAALLFFYN